MDYGLLIYLYQCSANNAVLATVLSGKGLISMLTLLCLDSDYHVNTQRSLSCFLWHISYIKGPESF